MHFLSFVCFVRVYMWDCVMGVGVVGPPSSTGELDMPRVCYNTLVKSSPNPQGVAAGREYSLVLEY